MGGETRFEKYPIRAHPALEDVRLFNNKLRELVAKEFRHLVVASDAASSVDRVNEWLGLLDPVDETDTEDEDQSMAVQAFLDTLHDYLVVNEHVFLRGQVYEKTELSDVDIRSQYGADLTMPLETRILGLGWDELVQAIMASRFIIDPNPYAELFALTTEEVTVIGELLFSDDPSPQGFSRAESAL